MHILLTGADGYIGRRLKRVLMLQKDISLRLMVRHRPSLSSDVRSDIEVIQADVLKKETLDAALEGIDVAYYLIHGLARPNYQELDRLSAQNFLEAAIRNKVKTIIYLGGLGEKSSASEHLLSRIETGEILSSRPDAVKCLWFRAGVIIGSGSASFEIIRNLVQKLPIMITPRWVESLITPIGVDDVIGYLDDAKMLNTLQNEIIDIGSETMSYGELMLRVAAAMGLRRRLIPVPLLTPKLSSYWLTIFTPVPYSVASSLIEGLKSEVVMSNNRAAELFNRHPITLEASVEKAIEEIRTHQIISRWSDSGGGAWEIDHAHDIATAVFSDRRVLPLGEKSPRAIFKSFCAIGGSNGWFGYDWLWKVRGGIDKLLGGAGINRGRRDSETLRIGDSLDFWKVVDLVEDERLLLYAQMKLPGSAWLEFKIHQGNLIQSAYFYPDGVSGRLYWYALIPLHHLIFANMAKKILQRA